MQMERKKKSHRKKIFYLHNVKWTSTNSDFEEDMENKTKNKDSIKNSLGQSPQTQVSLSSFNLSRYSRPLHEMSEPNLFLFALFISK